MWLTKIGDEIISAPSITESVKQALIEGQADWCINLVQGIYLDVDCKPRRLEWTEVGNKPWSYLPPRWVSPTVVEGWVDLRPYWAEWDALRSIE